MLKQGLAAGAAVLMLVATSGTSSAQDTIRLSKDARVGWVPPAPRGQLSDGNILAILSVRNAAEIEAGLIASQKGSTPAVREYGMMLVRDHRKAMAEGQTMARRHGIAVEAPGGYAAPMPPGDARAVINRRSTDAEQINAIAKEQDPRAEEKSYRDQVRGTDVQASVAVPARTPPREVLHEPRPAASSMTLKWMAGDTTAVRLGDDPISRTHADAMLRLQALSGAEFDRAFAEYAVIAHEAVLNEVQSRLLPDASTTHVRGMLETKPITLINHRKAAERLLR